MTNWLARAPVRSRETCECPIYFQGQQQPVPEGGAALTRETILPTFDELHHPLVPPRDYNDGYSIFSRGSVLVDYYLNLNGTSILDTGEIRNYFHMSLEKEGDHLKLGNFTVDTKSTDFIGNFRRFKNMKWNANNFVLFAVLRQQIVQGDTQRVVTGGVGEWVIAVIVVGLASLIFVIAFGTTMVRII